MPSAPSQKKVCGIPCSEISADWASQGIRCRSLTRAFGNALIPKKAKSGKVVKILIDKFLCPRPGPGMMWEKTRDDLLREEVVKLQHDGNRIVSVTNQWIYIQEPSVQAGRGGMHKYNNQDHAMMTGILAARNIAGQSWDVWRVNTEAEYLEED